MGKLFNALVMGTIITVALWIFNGNGLNPTNLMTLLLNPTGWEDSGFWVALTAFTTLTGGILIGLGVVIRQDWITRAGLITTISSITIAPYVAFFTFLAASSNYASTCSSTMSQTVCSQLNSIGGIGQIIAIVFVGPMFLYSLWACISWIFSPESTG